MAGPRDETAAPARDRGRLRASRADREQVIEALKTAFVHGRLTRAGLDTRAGQALIARTCADLAALTTDIPPVPAAPAAAGLARSPTPTRRWPLARAAAGAGGCLVIAFAAVQFIHLADPGATPGSIPKFWFGPCFVVALVAVVAALIILVLGVEASLAQRRSRKQRPCRAHAALPAAPAGAASRASFSHRAPKAVFTAPCSRHPGWCCPGRTNRQPGSYE